MGKAELNKKVFIRDGYNDGRNRRLRVLERTPDITLTAKVEVGMDKVKAGLLPEVLTAMVDYDSDAIHDGSEKIHKDAERRNELQLLSGVAYFTVTTDRQMTTTSSFGCANASGGSCIGISDPFLTSP